MNSLNNLTKKYFKAAKTRNRLIIITIILTTCLLTSIGILSNSIQNMLISNITNQTGTAHGRYKFIDNETFETIERHNKIETAGEWIELGTSGNEELGNNTLVIAYADENYMDMNNISLVKGTLPKNTNEIAIEQWILEKFNIQPELGEKIHLKYHQSNKTLDWKKIYYEGEKEFIICGILKSNDYFKQVNTSISLISKDFITKNVSEENLERNAYVRVKSKRNISDTVNEIASNLNLSEDQISINEQYIGALGGDIQSLIPFIILGLVIMIAASIVIYNIFYISVTQRINQFGLLKAIGITKKQLRKIIMREGLILSLIGIPLGILLGHVISYAIFPFIKMDTEINISSSIVVIIVTALVSIITVIISLRKPSKIAAKISPIDAIRYTGFKNNVKKLERKSSGKLDIKKIAHLSFWRNKKRTVLTILSLTMSGMLFIIFSTVLSSMNMENLTRNYVMSDFQLTSNNASYGDNKTDPLNKDLLNRIKSMDGVKNVSTYKFKSVLLSEKYIPTAYKKDGMSNLDCCSYGFDSSILKEMKAYVTEGKLSIDELKNNNYVFVLDKKHTFKIGDKIKLNYYPENSNSNELKEKEFTIKGFINDNPYWLGWKWCGPTFITHEETLEREFEIKRITRINVNFDNKNSDQLENTLKTIANNNDDISYDSYKEVKTKYENTQRGIEIAAYSLLGIIALIGIMNVINTMITSIMSRKKEFGLLQAVGLTNKQLTKMLQIEGLYYALISGIIAILLGTSFGYILFNEFKKEATYAAYKFPIKPILLVVFTFIFLQILITYLVKSKLNKDSIVDRIRYND